MRFLQTIIFPLPLMSTFLMQKFYDWGIIAIFAAKIGDLFGRDPQFCKTWKASKILVFKRLYSIEDLYPLAYKNKL